MHQVLNKKLKGKKTFREAKQEIIDLWESEFFRTLLENHKGNVSRAGREIYMDRSNFSRILRKHKINPQDYRK